MAERPILFNGGMVRAILDGRKTQTRRVIMPQPELYTHRSGAACLRWRHVDTPLVIARECMARHCPYGAPGDRLWVRETWAVRALAAGLWVEYHADGHNARLPAAHEHDIRDEGGKVDLARYALPADRWSPSIHMPRWAARLTLEIAGVRVERVQDISHHDALAEGVAYDVSQPDGAPVPRFRALWGRINGARGYGWEVNPWVWVVTFRRAA